MSFWINAVNLWGFGDNQGRDRAMRSNDTQQAVYQTGFHERGSPAWQGTFQSQWLWPPPRKGMRQRISGRGKGTSERGLRVWVMLLSAKVRSLWARDLWRSAAVFGLLELQSLSYLWLADVRCNFMGCTRQVSSGWLRTFLWMCKGLCFVPMGFGLRVSASCKMVITWGHFKPSWSISGSFIYQDHHNQHYLRKKKMII